MTFQQIQKYERGANRVSASMLTRIAKTLGVPVAEMFGEARPAHAPGFEEQRKREEETDHRGLEPFAENDGAGDGDNHE